MDTYHEKRLEKAIGKIYRKDLKELVEFINKINCVGVNVPFSSEDKRSLCSLCSLAKEITEKYGFEEKEPEKCCGTCGWWEKYLLAYQSSSRDHGECRVLIDCKKMRELPAPAPFWFWEKMECDGRAYMSAVTKAAEGKDCKRWKEKE